MHQAPGYDHSSADSRPEDHTKDSCEAGTCAIGCLRQGETVGIVGEANRTIQDGGQVVIKRPAQKRLRILVLDLSGCR